jgi:hypothetical protein
MTKTIAIIPIKGRETLAYHTIKRLVNDNIRTVCVGHTMAEKCVVECAGGDFIKVKDRITLGAKWQLALDKARELSPDQILYMGSSDFVSHNWVKVIQQDLDNGYAMTGTKGIYFLDIQPQNKKRMIWWEGYLKDRSDEPIGTGRLFSAKMLDLMNWRLFDTTQDHSIDFYQLQSLRAYTEMWPKDKLICYNDSKEIASLSISTYRWENKHNFAGESKYPTAKIMQSPDNVLNKYFKEVINLFNE